MKRKDKYIRNDLKIKSFGQRLREVRKQKGMTMQELADTCDMEYSQLSRIERGLINTSLSVVFEIAEALKIDPKELFEL